jgi:hypothetical protein
MKTRAWLGVAILTVTALSCRDLAGHGQLPTDAGDPTPTRLWIQAPGIALTQGQTTIVRAIAYDARGNLVPSPPVRWSSSSPSVATITDSGLVTALHIGTTFLLATAGRLSATAAITVAGPTTAAVVLPQGEFGDTIQLAPGQTLQLTGVEYNPRDASLLQPSSSSTATWVSSSPPVAAVTSSGFVTAIAEGDAQIAFSRDSLSAYRSIRVARTQGSVRIRFINPNDRGLTIRKNNGEPVVSLGSGEVHEETMTAGTVFTTVDQFPGFSPPWCACFYSGETLQQFLGYLPDNSRLTLVATSDQLGFAFAPLWDWNAPISKDSVMVRVLLQNDVGYNVYFVDVGGKMIAPYLQGCYLDWPYGVADYGSRAAKPFDIVLQSGKFSTHGPEAGRFTVTPEPGTATTYIITAAGTRVLTVVDYR